jgi:hypothetical protein
MKAGDEVAVNGAPIGTVTSIDYAVPCPGRCHGERSGTAEPHPCPYDEDVNDMKVMCRCCRACEQECCDDI